MRTFMANPEQIERKWYILDASGKSLGRLASEAARILRGKHKPIYTPHVDTGDYVIIVNADKVVLTGNKPLQKQYYHHSRFPGGLKSESYEHLLATRPELAVEMAVKGMLPHNSLGRQMFRKLHVYAGEQHKQQAQKPEVWQIRD